MGEEWIRLEPRQGGDTGIMVGKDKRELGTEKRISLDVTRMRLIKEFVEKCVFVFCIVFEVCFLVTASRS